MLDLPRLISSVTCAWVTHVVLQTGSCVPRVGTLVLYKLQAQLDFFSGLPMFASRYGPSWSHRICLVLSPPVLLNTLSPCVARKSIADPSVRFVARKKASLPRPTQMRRPVEHLPQSKSRQLFRSDLRRLAILATERFAAAFFASQLNFDFFP